MQYLVGVDCGGTKTEAVAYQLNGEEISRHVTGFGNLIVDYDIGLENIKAAIAPLFRQLGPENCQLIVCGIAGIDSGGLREQLVSEFADYPAKVVFINDGQLAHYSILKGQDGISVTAGTGSVFLARVNEEWYRAGGWGHLLGDEGSAHWIAKEAIKLVLAEYDEGLDQSDFSQAVLTYFGARDVLALVKKVYHIPKGELAQLASLVAELAAKESQAQNLLETAGVELAKGVIRLSKQMPSSVEPLLIGLNGSVIEHNHQVRTAFFNYLTQWQQPRELIFSEKIDSCAKGVYYYNQKDGIK